ncbi:MULTISPECIES: helix-turn-helix domain-containing protein [Actinomadura]|uniref:Scr1 family TA system antitoxin-like transcriptional regulator n=1 Tax=Actinomadura yumaensis TaxID=111807 RepID=A0ABW2CT79_9ACTN|nr:helix-turn-helix transcriptional regulator [Actinomadura sp. J1-007]MWK36237.1 helix-turn-helix domain-containing protein [Actinomadura sp. J1-007]
MPPKSQDDSRDFDPRSSAFSLFAHKMRRYRERDRLSQAQVGAACNVSGKLISAIENLWRLPGLDVSVKLDRLFGSDFFEDQYYAILRESELTPNFRGYAKQEDQAASVHVYEPLMVPGLFQTKAYLREALKAGQREEQLQEMVAVRLGRQDILERDEPPFIVALIREAVLREIVGGVEVTREQLEHLIELGRRPKVKIQAVPVGAPVYVSGPFALLRFAEGADLGYVEAALGQGRVVERPAIVQRMAVRFDEIQSEALSAPESERLIRSIMEEL